jgi:hypothetical protein
MYIEDYSDLFSALLMIQIWANVDVWSFASYQYQAQIEA